MLSNQIDCKRPEVIQPLPWISLLDDLVNDNNIHDGTQSDTHTNVDHVLDDLFAYCNDEKE